MKIAKKIRPFLRLVATISLDETDGSEIINGSPVFDFISSTFKYWGLDFFSNPTKKMNVCVYQIIRDGTFKDFFSELSNILNDLVLTQSQIIQFVRKNKIWLAPIGYTFFTLKSREDFFLADVKLYHANELRVLANQFSYDKALCVKDRHWIVVPQLTHKVP